MTDNNNERTGSLGFETKLWEAADLLRNNMDSAEYKHVVLGLCFSSTSRTASRNDGRIWGLLSRILTQTTT